MLEATRSSSEEIFVAIVVSENVIGCFGDIRDVRVDDCVLSCRQEQQRRVDEKGMLFSLSMSFEDSDDLSALQNVVY